MTLQLAAGMVSVLLAGFANGVSGFGFALLSAPALLLVFEPSTVVALLAFLSLIISAMVVAGGWKAVSLRVVAALLPGGVAGLLFGTELLRVVSRTHLQLAVGVLVVTFSVLLLRGVTLPVLLGRWGGTVAGSASGVLATTTGLSGPPVVLYFSARGFPKEAFRVNISAYFLIIGAVGLITLLGRQLVHGSDVRVALLLLPASVLGNALGAWVAKGLSERAFRRLPPALTLLTGALGVATALRALGN